MEQPVIDTTPLGTRFTYVFSGELTRRDFVRMDVLLIDALMWDWPAQKFITDKEPIRVVITHTGARE